MRIFRSVVLALTVAAFAHPAAEAEEPYLEFLQGLRDRNYYDYALEYLDQIQSDPNCPAEIKAVVPFEKASTLLVMARGGTITNPEVQSRQLEQALGYLNEFIQASPDHPRAGEANSQRAGILLGKARVEVWQSRSPSNKENRAEFQKRARELIANAREIYQTAHDQHQETWEAFPKFIDKIEDPQLYEERRQAEVQYIIAQLDLAHCLYEESQTYDRDSQEYAAKLREAADAYEEIHSKYRSQIGGLYARTWQGKCYEEQDDIQRALGIYKELLDHPGNSATLNRLQDQVRHFRLVSLNHEKRKDYQLVIDEATEWLNQARGRKKYSKQALGIRWQQVLAQEKLAEDRTLPEDERQRLLKSALSGVRIIKRFPGEYKDLATFKERDLNVKLKGAGASDDPEDFATAFSLGQELATKKTKPLLNEVRSAQKSGDQDKIREAQTKLKQHLDRAQHLLRLALRLADEETPVRDLNLARYWLSYMHLLARNNYESAVLGEFIAFNYGEENPVRAQDAAYMAMAAYVQAFNDNGKANRKRDQEIDVSRMEKIAEYLVDKWPNSDRAMDARMQLGSVYGQLEQSVESADWYSKVPETASQYTKAQIQAGQAYWAAYIEAASREQAEQPPQSDLEAWMNSAEEHLRTGIAEAEADTPDTTPPSKELVAAKLSLVQILVSRSKYEECIEILTGEPHSVMQAIAVEDESKRPQSEGIKSVDFAALANQLLLRCYVGTQDLDKALGTMDALEKVSGGGGEALTEIYRQIGQQLQDELERLKNQNQMDRFQAVRKSFETFLNELSRREDQTLGSLIWIGETYYGLAKSSEDPTAASAFYDQAATAYQSILDRAKEDPEFIDQGRLVSVRLRMANCKRNQGAFQEALDLVTTIVAGKPTYLDGQVEANRVYQDWGTEGQEEPVEKLRMAMQGDREAGIWGWGQTARRLQRLLERGGSETVRKYEEKYYNARYNLARCQLEMGLAQSGAKKTEALEQAKRQINSFVRITGNFSEEWWPKFDNLYREIQTAMGLIPEPLEKPEEYVPPPETETVAQTPSPDVDRTSKKKRKAEKKKDDGGSGMTYALFGLVALLGLGGGGFMVFKGTKSRRPSVAMGSGDVDSATIAPPPATKPRRKKAAAPRQAKKSSSGTKQATAGTDSKQAAGAGSKQEAAGSASGGKPKRPLTPEEKEKLRRRKAAQAKAQQQKKKPEGE